MAPEVANTQVSYNPMPADIYSLGMTLAESLTGIDKQNSNSPRLIKLWTAAKFWTNRTFQNWGINFEVSDLLTKMTYRESYKRPNIQEVHSHPFVVNRAVKMNNTKIITVRHDSLTHDSLTPRFTDTTIHWHLDSLTHDSLTPRFTDTRFTDTRFTDTRFTDNTKSVVIHFLGPTPNKKVYDYIF
jgi:serine/threonine protein kinase